ncbi:MAG: acetyl-CoA decarbonylase/synthase complex subunit delta [Chloroflexi bacterium]|nr:acetyl-CoA decarbonylase/synthase complex subunit delta [Chloroflexota bacterium]
MPAVELPVQKWPGRIHEVTLGGNGRKKVVVGGEATLPFLHFEGAIPHRPAIAIEVHDRNPAEWAENLRQVWGSALKSPAAWAKKASELGADLIALRLSSAHPENGNTGAEAAKKNVAQVLEAVDLPVIVLGPEVAEKDNEVLMAAAEAARGQRLAIGDCMEKNYRTIAAACIANGHVAIGKTPIEINLAKQLNILISDVGVSRDAILMDPTTGALGYGLEYSYSVMERLRLAGLQGDAMTAMPMICTVGEEAWRQKEARVSEGVPTTWGQAKERAILWEGITAISLLEAGADIVVLRHPRSVELARATIDKLMAGAGQRSA